MRKLVIANWKMNMIGSQIHGFVSNFRNPKPNRAEVAVAAPNIYLSGLKSKRFILAAQNVSTNAPGSYTGEISAAMLKDVGVKYCLVGHSERRIYWNETDNMVNSQLQNLLSVQIIPVLCIGETASERKSRRTNKVLARQLKIGLKNAKDSGRIVIAYEPVWAISGFQKGKALKAGDSDIIQAHKFIKAQLVNIFGESGKKIRVLYGGSVNPENCAGFINSELVDGVLVGAASLDPKKLSKIISAIR